MNSLKSKLIINPMSGTRNAGDTERMILRLIDNEKFDLEVLHSTRPDHAFEIAREFADKSDVIFVAGGDGTVNEVGQALINKSAALGIFPCGSGNGIARSLGIPVNLRRALAHYNDSPEFKTIDTALFNGKPYIGVAGIGFDALISHEFHNFEKRGLQGYVKAFSNKIIKYKAQHFEIEFEGNSITETGYLAVIANSDQFGNNAMISPLAKMDDGLLNLTLVRDIPKILIPSQVLRLFSGNLHKSPHVLSLIADSFTIRSEFKMAHIDGEPIVNQNEAFVEIVPASLKVFI